MTATIQASLTGAVDKCGAGTVPVIECNRNKPVFYESGYASGHAREDIAVPGLLDWLRDHAPERDTPADTGHLHYWQGQQHRTGWCWCWVQFKDKRALVFLAHVYDGRSDTYSMTN